jgi:threonine/homoserine/homoserine lactone efflux protein
MSLAFLLTSLVVVIAPGAGVLYTLSAGLSRGARASVVAAFGCTLGILPHMAAAITGLAALLYASSVAFEALKFLGCVYLLYMAWNTLRETGALNIETSSAPGSALRIVLRGILVNILNPKLSLFFFAFLPQFVNAGAPDALPHMLELSFVFMLMTFVVFTIYGVFAAAVRSQIVSRPRVLAWMRRSFAAVFVLLGARLAFAER